jgi:hypothetical protein
MISSLQRACALLVAFIVPALSAFANGSYHEITYLPSKDEGELVFPVTYRMWIPEGVKMVRGVIVHQHGCGVGSRKGAEPGAKDIHWQALARKWDCVLLVPSYQQEEKDNCRLWCDPRNGSAKTFLRCLADLGVQSGHLELANAPWCLWGHSGGGFWASVMQMLYPDRIVAIWFRSGTAFEAWEKGEVTKPEIPDAAMRIPMMCNPGAKENGDKRFNGAWTGTLAMFKAYRAKGAPIGFAPDPRTSHETGDSRYLAIPFFDACLAARLPAKSGEALKPVNAQQAWLAPLLGGEAKAAGDFSGNASEAVWLPNANVARAWMQYVKTGETEDTTPPPAPTKLKAAANPDGVALTWDAVADLESGLKAFIIQRDGKDLAQHPEKPQNKFGRPLFQNMSYGDTPVEPLPEFAFTDRTAKASEHHDYRVIAVNTADLKSAPSAPASVK